MRRQLLASLVNKRKRTSLKPGQAMIEMALVLMLLLVLTFGIVDAGLYMFRFVQATNCTREVARRAAVRDANPLDVPYCVSADLRGNVVLVGAGGDPGADVTASLDVDHEWLVIDHLIPGMNPTIPIHSQTTMRLEGQKV